MTELVLITLLVLAALASIGVIVPMDRTSDIIMPFIASALWGVAGMSAFDVILLSTSNPVRSTEILPVAYLGVGFALISAVLGVYELIVQPAKEVEDAADSELM